ncbi:MAG: hypothetical protein NTX25_10470 [Proteobacteria bacterium]|nr:hypothetical protein [Pseudomonadota bacterium]
MSYLRLNRLWKLALLSLISISCMKSSSKSSRAAGSHAAAEALPQESVGGFPLEASVASFKKNVYSPILEPYCRSCHDKTFVDGNIQAAHKSFLLRVNFDKFTSVDQTPIIAKMRQNHNCWQAGAKKCVEVMDTAIKLWLADLSTYGFTPSPMMYPNKTKDVAFSSAQKSSVIIDSTQYAGASVQQATLADPFVIGTDDVDGSIASYAMGRAGTPAITDGAGPSSAQFISFNVNVKATGTYRLWARVKTPSDLNNGFFVALNNNSINFFDTPVTGPMLWKWVQFAIPNSSGDPIPIEIPVTTTGGIPLTILFRAPEAKINYVVMTQKMDEFDGEQFSNQFYDVAVELPFPNSRILAMIWEKTTAEGKKSLGVRELRIESPMRLHVKTIYPLINGVFNQNQSTYTIVDTIAGGSTDRNSQIIRTGGATASTWIADMNTDRLSFAFEVLELAE